MKHPDNVIYMPCYRLPQGHAREAELAAALERARPAIIAACARAKGLRTAHRTRLLQQAFGPQSTGTA
ncbi:hypothetical protein PVT71_18395 [Salipiger sp. H15]|uniref:Uncharacterized protein n=1 Tax=Alloyangia sp. H15 TaxID=3029062 RepID=A0AAU8ANU3_9RHOB